MQIVIEPKTPVYLSPDEALLFIAFQKNYQLIANILGTMDSMGFTNLRSASVALDFDANGAIQHSSITKHYRK